MWFTYVVCWLFSLFWFSDLFVTLVFVRLLGLIVVCLGGLQVWCLWVFGFDFSVCCFILVLCLRIWIVVFTWFVMQGIGEVVAVNAWLICIVLRLSVFWLFDYYLIIGFVVLVVCGGLVVCLFWCWLFVIVLLTVWLIFGFRLFVG